MHAIEFSVRFTLVKLGLFLTAEIPANIWPTHLPWTSIAVTMGKRTKNNAIAESKRYVNFAYFYLVWSFFIMSSTIWRYTSAVIRTNATAAMDNTRTRLLNGYGKHIFCFSMMFRRIVASIHRLRLSWSIHFQHQLPLWQYESKEKQAYLRVSFLTSAQIILPHTSDFFYLTAVNKYDFFIYSKPQCWHQRTLRWVELPIQLKTTFLGYFKVTVYSASNSRSFIEYKVNMANDFHRCSSKMKLVLNENDSNLSTFGG